MKRRVTNQNRSSYRTPVTVVINLSTEGILCASHRGSNLQSYEKDSSWEGWTIDE